MKIFFSGIGGSGVSAIAGFMAERGHSVAGSDRLFDSVADNTLCRSLKSGGISIVPQDGRGIDGSFDLAIFSTAVEQENPDFKKALAACIPVKTRPEYLSEMVSAFSTIAVAGTSGKSTTSGMLAFLMERLGMGPNFIGGGRVKQFRNGKNPGNYLTGFSSLLVIEACESDGTIVNYRPSHSVIANLDVDHHSIGETAAMFARLAANTSSLVITGGDDKNLSDYHIRGTVTFSIERESDYRATEIEYLDFGTTFRVKGQKFGLSLPGRHNLYNALACIAVLSEMGVAVGEVAAALPEFTGIERRFDVHLNDGKHLVIDDYAHNPHKISSLMETVLRLGGDTCYIFQPHGYAPTRMMKEGYIETFSKNMRDTDHLVILPIYYAGGTTAKDISSADLASGIAAKGRSVMAINNRDEIFDMSFAWRNYVTLGARDDSLSDLAQEIAARLSL